MIGHDLQTDLTDEHARIFGALFVALTVACRARGLSDEHIAIQAISGGSFLMTQTAGVLTTVRALETAANTELRAHPEKAVAEAQAVRTVGSA